MVAHVYDFQQYVILGPEELAIRIHLKNLSVENQAYLNVTLMLNELNNFSYIILCFGQPPLNIYGIALLKKVDTFTYAILGSQNKWYRIRYIPPIKQWTNISIIVLKKENKVVIMMNDDVFKFNTTIGRIQNPYIYITLGNVNTSYVGLVFVSKLVFYINGGFVINVKGVELYELLNKTKVSGKGRISIYSGNVTKTLISSIQTTTSITITPTPKTIEAVITKTENATTSPSITTITSSPSPEAGKSIPLATLIVALLVFAMIFILRTILSKE